MQPEKEDPITMYLVVRESLNMGAGKTAAQCAHASQMLTIKYWELNNSASEKLRLTKSINNNEQQKLQIFIDWLNSYYRKVVLKADDKEWAKLKQLDNYVLVIDNGLTEIAPNSETVIGFWPVNKSKAPKIIKRLQVLK